ncbi:N-glycosyltransferase [Hartmannibacter diazotrophicus]|uniref:N-glycosyltransferase n=1 Tax=Hartmannibacter diazotrophicus TaxID=1482074 RepID=A0A2C9D112_9HYPH|nr:glycosyltransferase family 2 protein [Hartmannibacter diazotrophicus]SON53913.1 N-glycosyltransferase [Hartmannibacter diazotrophicus]
MSVPEGYSIHRVDLDAAVEPVAVESNRKGVALEVFRGPRPVGFLMAAHPAGTVLSAEAISDWIRRDIPEEWSSQPISRQTNIGPMPTVTIVICTKDHPDLLKRCLEGIGRLVVAPEDPRPEILVIDNASSTDETRRVAEAFEGVRCVREEKKGLNFARNRALKEARGEILAFIDDDAVPDIHWLGGLRQAWSLQPEAGAFAGQTLPYCLDTEAQVLVESIGGFRKGFLPIVFGRQYAPQPLYPVATIFGNGCNMAFRVDVMRALGGFDTALDMGAALPGGGDLDALYRVARNGHDVVYEPQMLMRHEHRPDMAGLRRQVRKSWGMGCMAFLVKIRDDDPEMSDKARLFIHWWMRSMIAQLRPFSKAKLEMPWRLMLLQFIGAATALTGTYRRSQKLAAEIAAATGGNGD